MLRHTRMTLREPKLYLKLVVGVKTTGTSEGYNDRKRRLKESKSSYPTEGRPSSKKRKADLLYVSSKLDLQNSSYRRIIQSLLLWKLLLGT